ncbi:MAG TPA: tyrosine-type recombinase/integrase [Bacteroidia bacterium]|nr:tyrosine-type recombinase/integrase [Bacteroidia bacterium]
MASLRKHPRSPYWFACFTDKEGRQRQRSTHVRRDGTVEGRRLAQKVADSYEDAYRKERTSTNVQRTIRDLHLEITGEELPLSSIGAYLNAWVNRKRNEVTENTLQHYGRCVMEFIEFLGEKADKPISLISAEQVREFRDHQAEKVAAKTVNHRLKTIRMALGAARRDGFIADNPAELVPIVKDSTSPGRRAFTMDELRRVIEECSPEWRSMVFFGLYTGQRLGDISRLTWRSIDLEKNEIRFIARKTGKSAIIPISLHLRRHIEVLPAGDDPDQPVHPQAAEAVAREGKVGSLSRQFYEIMARAGLVEKRPHRKHPGKEGRKGRGPSSSISFHALRHTATSLLKNAGISSAIVEEFIGHDSSEINRIYTHIEIGTLKSAADQLPNLVD